MVLRNQVLLGTVNADHYAFENAIADVEEFKARWPREIAAVITGRYPMESYRELLLGKARAASRASSRSRVGREGRVERYDVVIIGTGAGGGTLLHRLAPTGKRSWSSSAGRSCRGRRTTGARGRSTLRRSTTRRRCGRTRRARPPPAHQLLRGGNTKFYGAALFRMRKEDFGELRHHGGVSPAWPVSYDDFEPYYAEAEALYHVHGKRGEDPTEPWSSGPFPHPAVSHEPRIQKFSDDVASLGYKPFHTPLAVMLDEKNPRSRCIRCETCDGFPCLVEAKGDAEVCCIAPALRHPNVTLLTEARATRLLTSPSGREVTASRSSATATSRPMPRTCSSSRAGDQLRGPAAGVRERQAPERPRQLVGRGGAPLHGSRELGAARDLEHPNPTVFQKTFSMNDFYLATKEWEYPMGHISFVGKLDG